MIVSVSASPALALRVSASSHADVCDAYVASHPAASAYHDPRWMDVVHKAFGHQTRYLAADCDGQIVGVLPLVLFSSRLFGRFAVSVPFVNYGGILADSQEAAQALLEAAVEETTRAGGSHVELRHTTRIFAGALPAREHKVAMRLALETTCERQWEALDRKLRNQIRKAERNRLTIEVGGKELLGRFHQVFARNMRDLGTPVYGMQFFREVLETFPDATRVFVVMLDDRPVASSVVLWHRNTIEVPWASSIRDFNALCVNVFLYWHMLRFAIERGFRTFDFGRSTPGEGTFNFKRQWGADPYRLVWEYWTKNGSSLPDLIPTNPKYAFAIRTWQRIPLPLANALGPLIVRNIP